MNDDPGRTAGSSRAWASGAGIGGPMSIGAGFGSGMGTVPPLMRVAMSGGRVAGERCLVLAFEKARPDTV